jgi:hypothetical protein
LTKLPVIAGDKLLKLSHIQIIKRSDISRKEYLPDATVRIIHVDPAHALDAVPSDNLRTGGHETISGCHLFFAVLLCAIAVESVNYI